MLIYSQDMKKRQYLSSWAKYEKSKGTLLSSTFKVGEGKVPLFFLIYGSGAEIFGFSHLQSSDSSIRRHRY